MGLISIKRHTVISSIYSWSTDARFYFEVLFLTTAQEANAHMHEMKITGFPGCVSSMNATHITMDQCPNKHHQLHVGFKLKFQIRVYNVSVNHKWQILFSTDGHPASWNDKTLQTFDKVVRQIWSRHLLADMRFILSHYWRVRLAVVTKTTVHIQLVVVKAFWFILWDWVLQR